MNKMHSEFITWLCNLAAVYGQEVMGKEREYWTVWQAASAVQSVPVVGEPVAWQYRWHTWAPDHWEGCSQSDYDDRESIDGKNKYRELIIQPAHSITAAELRDFRCLKMAAESEAQRVNELTAELDALRKDAGRYHTILKIMFDDWHPITVAATKMPEPKDESEMSTMLDAAIAGSGESK